MDRRDVVLAVLVALVIVLAAALVAVMRARASDILLSEVSDSLLHRAAPVDPSMTGEELVEQLRRHAADHKVRLAEYHEGSAAGEDPPPPTQCLKLGGTVRNVNGVAQFIVGVVDDTVSPWEGLTNQKAWTADQHREQARWCRAQKYDGPCQYIVFRSLNMQGQPLNGIRGFLSAAELAEALDATGAELVWSTSDPHPHSLRTFRTN